MNKPNILITGGCGFIGTNLINDLLKKKIANRIVCIDNMSHGTFLESVHDKVEMVYGDIRNKVIEHYFKDIDYVFHFAGLVSIYDCDKNPYDAFDNNIMGSINVFDACIKHKVKKIIFSETSAMYEDSNILPHVETDWNPKTLYATSKSCLHLLAASYRKTKGLNYTGLRYFNVAGPLQDYTRTIPPLFAGVALRLMNNKGPIIFGDETRRRDFIHVDDVNQFHIKCIFDYRTTNQVFNLGTGISYSLKEIVEIIEKYIDVTLPTIYMPEINGEAHTIYANIDKAKSIGWLPKKTIHHMIKDTIDFLVKEMAAGKVSKNFMENIDLASVKIG
jgi:nucleoside-diphosphate-sugar epimerase